MKKFLLSLVAVLVLASFTTIKDPVILKDIDGTLLKSYVTLQTVDNQTTATFTVDANTLVTSITDKTGTHIYLIENGTSGVSVEHTVAFATKRIGFNSYFSTNADVASTDDLLKTNTFMYEKPTGILKGEPE